MGDLVKLERARYIKRVKKRMKALLDERLVRYSEHAVSRLRERGLDLEDVHCVVRRGRLTRGGTSEFSRTPGRYMLEGRGVDGGDIVCVVEINGVLVLVTAWSR